MEGIAIESLDTKGVAAQDCYSNQPPTRGMKGAWRLTEAQGGVANNNGHPLECLG